MALASYVFALEKKYIMKEKFSEISINVIKAKGIKTDTFIKPATVFPEKEDR